MAIETLHAHPGDNEMYYFDARDICDGRDITAFAAPTVVDAAGVAPNPNVDSHAIETGTPVIDGVALVANQAVKVQLSGLQDDTTYLVTLTLTLSGGATRKVTRKLVVSD